VGMFFFLEILSGIIEFLIPFAFLLVSYRFSTLFKSYELTAFKELSWGFRFLFMAYFLPIAGALVGNLIHEDNLVDLEFVYMGLPYYISAFIGVGLCFKATKSFIAFANA